MAPLDPDNPSEPIEELLGLEGASEGAKEEVVEQLAEEDIPPPAAEFVAECAELALRRYEEPAEGEVRKTEAEPEEALLAEKQEAIRRYGTLTLAEVSLLQRSLKGRSQEIEEEAKQHDGIAEALLSAYLRVLSARQVACKFVVRCRRDGWDANKVAESEKIRGYAISAYEHVHPGPSLSEPNPRTVFREVAEAHDVKPNTVNKAFRRAGVGGKDLTREEREDELFRFSRAVYELHAPTEHSRIT